MLTSIRLKDFKSYRDTTLPVAGLTFFIGANASGKSNALEAIRLLNWLAKGTRLDDIARSIQAGDTVIRGQVGDLFRDNDSTLTLGCRFNNAELEGWEEFEIVLSFANERLVVKSERITGNQSLPLYYVDGEAGAHSDEISVAYNNLRRGKKPHIPCSNSQAIFYQLETPGRFAAADERAQQLIPKVTKQIRETLRKIVFLDPRPAVMRGYAYQNDDQIMEDGKNLSAVLYHIAQDPVQKARLLDFVRSLPEQDITDIQFIETDRKDVMVRLVESFGEVHRTVDAPLLSDGTLRVLAIGATLLSAPLGALVIVEEIDNGVHPSRAESLVRQLQSVAAERQLRILLTSHNPALLDALPDSALNDVVVCYRDTRDGDSRLLRLGDMDRYPELVAQGPLGHLMTQRVLDRYVKDQRSPEQRQDDALSWLERYKTSAAGNAA